MKTQKDDKRLEQSAKALFEESVARLDEATLSKLNQGRQSAIAELEDGSPARQWARWMPATGVATVALLAIVVFRSPADIDVPIASDPTITDFEILLGEDSLEMIEDLEFYSWIDLADLESTDNVG